MLICFQLFVIFAYTVITPIFYIVEMTQIVLTGVNYSSLMTIPCFAAKGWIPSCTRNVRVMPPGSALLMAGMRPMRWCHPGPYSPACIVMLTALWSRDAGWVCFPSGQVLRNVHLGKNGEHLGKNDPIIFITRLPFFEHTEIFSFWMFFFSSWF